MTYNLNSTPAVCSIVAPMLRYDSMHVGNWITKVTVV